MQRKNKHILGVHLGHDASVSVLADGEIVAHVLQERISRIRHDYGLDLDTIQIALQEAGINTSQIHSVAITGTQQTPSIIRNTGKNRVSLNFSASEANLHNASKLENFPKELDSNDVYSKWLLEILSHRKVNPRLYENSLIFDVKDPISDKFGYQSVPFSQVLQVIKDFSKSSQLKEEDLRFDLTLTIDGIEIPGSWWSHHLAHARSNLSIGKSGERIIISIDGGEGALSGCVWHYDKRGRISLITPHYIEVGRFYEFVANKLGLGIFGHSAGKLMGLAGYSLSKKGKNLPIGTILDWARFEPKVLDRNGIYESLFEEIIDLSFSTKEHFSMWDGDVTDERAIQVAKIAQNLVEESLCTLSETIQERFGGEIFLGITGGVALNCPTNTLLNKHFPDRIIIEPHCDDGGISIGSALLEENRTNHFPRDCGHSSTYAFKGIERIDEELDVLINKGLLKELKSPDLYLEIAKRIANENAIIGIFSKKSETGPRALGSRSILADARQIENWKLLNTVKQREFWRPFAPAILDEELENWFVDGPKHSPFMLFNYKVRDEKRSLIPAVVHFDGTSRVQTVDSNTKPLRPILDSFYAETSVPILLNTSFNGPGEPIVEFVRNAYEMGVKNGLNYLLVFNRLFFFS